MGPVGGREAERDSCVTSRRTGFTGGALEATARGFSGRSSSRGARAHDAHARRFRREWPPPDHSTRMSRESGDLLAGLDVLDCASLSIIHRHRNQCCRFGNRGAWRVDASLVDICFVLRTEWDQRLSSVPVRLVQAANWQPTAKMAVVAVVAERPAGASCAAQRAVDYGILGRCQCAALYAERVIS
jgi:hypothetical protein